MDVAIVIPARMASTRFPGKPLADLLGKPMIQWVFDRSRKARGIQETVIATDDPQIQKVASEFGAKVLMTSPTAASGTDRVAEAAERLSADIIVNVQGDEPLIDCKVIEAAVDLVRSGRFAMATAATPFRAAAEILDANRVKVVTDVMGRAISFSRHPIPYSRVAPPEIGPWICRQHVGLYVYRREALARLAAARPVSMEQTEGLEQLRALAYGIDIGVADVEYECFGVDTASDLEVAKSKLKAAGFGNGKTK